LAYIIWPKIFGLYLLFGQKYFGRYHMTNKIWPMLYDLKYKASIIWPIIFIRYYLTNNIWPISFGQYYFAYIIWPKIFDLYLLFDQKYFGRCHMTNKIWQIIFIR
jgi:hypothetical protein